ncbi:MAG: hypothetical protein KAX11_08250 [Candidatus Aminicenantes bacterium]|nr:hypothetical protein [Candidatus Aminicenantes bacterium]
MSNKNDSNVIEVSFNEEGRVGVKEWVIWRNHDEPIKWESDSPFAIHFHKFSPLESMVFNSKKRESDGRHVVEASVVFNPRDTGARKFSYYVASIQGETIDIVDPEIIIPRGPGR